VAILLRTSLAVRMPACRAHRHAPGWLLDFSFLCPPKNGSNYLVQASGKREANQWLMSSVLNWPSHEVWRETSEERANWPRTAKAVRSYGPKRLPLLGSYRPPAAAENVRIGGNGGGEEIRTHGTALRTPLGSWVFLEVPLACSPSDTSS
jgi:hypothetical protein